MLRTTTFWLSCVAVVGLTSTRGSSQAQNLQAAQNGAGLSAPQTPPRLQQLPAVSDAKAGGAPLAEVTSLPPQPGQLSSPGPLPQAGQLAQAGPISRPVHPGLGGPPFQLGAVEQQRVDQILQMWENESAKIKTFDCQFERWEYDAVFGPGNDIPSIKSTGQLTYSKPDKGSFKINELWRYKQESPQQPGDWVLQEHEVGEHWVCDGKAIHQYDHKKKQLVVQPLSLEMRGAAIVDGPLPFLFGAEAEKLKRRYWIRSTASNATSIYLEAYPRRQVDAASYNRVDVMLDRKKMMPTAIQVHMPNGQSRAVYMFKNPTVNGKLNALFGSIFNAPRTPRGWTRVVEELPSGPPQGPQATAPQESAHR